MGTKQRRGSATASGTGTVQYPSSETRAGTGEGVGQFLGGQLRGIFPAEMGDRGWLRVKQPRAPGIHLSARTCVLRREGARPEPRRLLGDSAVGEVWLASAVVWPHRLPGSTTGGDQAWDPRLRGSNDYSSKMATPGEILPRGQPC